LKALRFAAAGILSSLRTCRYREKQILRLSSNAARPHYAQDDIPSG